VGERATTQLTKVEYFALSLLIIGISTVMCNYSYKVWPQQGEEGEQPPAGP
jgi:hypothetical protein